MEAQLEDRPAPGQLELVRSFVNTRDIDEKIELFASAPDTTRWLRAAHLLTPRERIDERGQARLIRLREALRLMLVAHVSDVDTSAALADVNEEIERVEVRPSFGSPAAPVMLTVTGGVDGVIASIVSIALEAAYDGSWRRLKACPANDCHWAFYDASKNCSSRWCYMQLCGAKAKRETFRRRHPATRSPHVRLTT